MQGVYAILLLIVSNIFMTCAWYGHLKMRQQFSWFDHLPLFGVILFSWFLALFEYCFQVPANRIGFRDNGGPFSLMQLKVIQEVITLIVFILNSSAITVSVQNVFPLPVYLFFLLPAPAFSVPPAAAVHDTASSVFPRKDKRYCQ